MPIIKSSVSHIVNYRKGVYTLGIPTLIGCYTIVAKITDNNIG